MTSPGSPTTDSPATAGQPASNPAVGRTNLMRSLRLENFMLHEDSLVDFSAPITLITGANGSGKTQILDALLLALGAKSQRIRKQGISDLVGPAGDTARVTLALHNPKRSASGWLQTEQDDYDEGKLTDIGFRPLTTGNRETDRLTDHEVVHVVIDMSRDSDSLTYRLGPAGRERKVTAAAVSQLFSQAGVSPRNSLAFTEEGTIGNFTSDSPQKQFEQFLDTTSLLELRSTLVAVHADVGNCQARLEPLQQQWHMHKQLLEHMHSDLENLEKREELESRAKQLQAELAWAAARAVADEADALTKMREAQQQRHTSLQASRDKAISDLETLRVEIENLRTQIDSMEVQARNRAEKLGEKRAALQNARDNDASLSKSIEAKETKIAAIHADAEKAGKSRVEAEFAAVEDELAAATARLKELEKAITDGKRTANRSLRDGLPGGTLKARGLDVLLQCLKLRDAIGASDLASSCFGPLVLEWSLRPSLGKTLADRAGEALPVLLADRLTDFVAADLDALAALVELVSKTFDAPPPFRLHVAPESVALQALSKAQAKQLAALEDVLDGPQAVRNHLLATCPSALALDDRLALPTAQQLATDTGRTIWLPGGLVVGPTSVHWPDATSLEVADRLTAGLDQLKAAAEALARVRDLQPQLDEQKDAHSGVSRRHGDLLAQLDQHQRTLREADGLGEERDQLTRQRDAVRDKQKKLGKELEDLEARTTGDEKRHELETKLDKARRKRADLESKVDQHQRDIDSTWRKVGDLDVQLAETLGVAQEKKLAASALGPQPADVRTTHDVETELNQTLGTLEGLRRVTRTREEFELQQQHVNELQSQVEEARGHLDSLKGDLESRLAEWDRELGDRLTNACKVLRHLLRDHFTDVRLGVRDSLRRGRKKTGGAVVPASNGALDFRVQRTNGRLLNLSGLCGGEKVLVVEGLIFALHCLTDSPVHALDEFTQKLDVEFKSAAFRMALDAVAWARQHSKSVYLPQFVLLCPDTLGVEINSADLSHVVVIRSEADTRQADDDAGARDHTGTSQIAQTGGAA